MRARWILLIVLAASAVGCDPANRVPALPKRPVDVTVVDEAGRPVTTAQMHVIGSKNPIQISGTRQLKIDQPVAGTIEADGYLAEPFILDTADSSLKVRLFSRVGPTGVERLALHFGGDVMMARRYQNPAVRSDTPIARTAEGARSVVRHIAPIMRAADAAMTNVETVIGDLPDSGAYPAKRYLLQSPRIVLDALDEMGIDLATLGNNHAYDWKEAGIRSTTAALDQAGIPWTGVGLTQQEAEKGQIIAVGDRKVGVISASTISGDLFNDGLPIDGEPVRANLDPVDAWQYDVRQFGYGPPADRLYIDVADRRPGSTWALFSEIERNNPTLDVAPLWAAMMKVYPELLDSVARRGHGGAGLFDTDKVTATIADLRAQGADLVVVQVHGGLQFSETNGRFVQNAAHVAIDAGADIVIGHHPHVLHGFEWYRGHLIAYSLGNLVFDQDFLASFPSIILRTVFEGDQLLDAQAIPLVLDRYQPMPAGGRAADVVARLLDSRSALAGFTVRVNERDIGISTDATRPTNAAVIDNGSTLSIVEGRSSTAFAVGLDDSGFAQLGPCSLVRAGSVDGGRVGVNLFPWGSINDVTANGDSEGGAYWDRNGTITVGHDDGDQYLHLVPTTSEGVLARNIGRSSVTLHRWYDEALRPIDGDPGYEVRMRTRATGVDAATLRMSLFNVFDTDTAIEPVSVQLRDADVALPIVDSADWRTFSLDVSDEINLEVDGLRASSVLFYLDLPRKTPTLDIDDFQLIEWRDPSGLPPDQWIAADALRGSPGATLNIEISSCTGAPPDG